MKNRLIALLLSFVWCIVPALADGQRVNTAPDYPLRKLSKQFNSSTDSLYNGDPNSGNLTTTSATGLAPKDGLVTVCLGDITPTTTLTIWYWHPDIAKWIHMGAGTSDYTKAFGADYTSAQFSVPPQVAYLITTDTQITSFVYVSGRAHKDNANTVSGYEQ